MTWGEFKAEIENSGWNDDTHIAVACHCNLSTPTIGWTLVETKDGSIQIADDQNDYDNEACITIA